MSGVKSEVTTIWLSAVTSGANFLFSVIGLYLIENIGRRRLALCSLIGAVVSLVWLAVGFQLSAGSSPGTTYIDPDTANSTCSHHSSCFACMMDLSCGFCYYDSASGPTNSSCDITSYDNPWKATSGRCMQAGSPLTWAYDFCPSRYSWMPMLGLVLYLLFFAPGMLSIPWTVNSEIYPLWARSTGNAASTLCNWLSNLIVSMSFLSVVQALTRYGAFYLYASLAFVGFIVLWFILPETKGRSLEEVEELFAQPWCGRGPQWTAKNVQYVHIRGMNRPQPSPRLHTDNSSGEHVLH